MKRFYFIFFTLLAINATLYSAIDPLNGRGLYSAIHKKYKYLSPILGFNFFESGHLRNWYKLGDPNDAIVKLMRELFHEQPNGVFNITRADGKPATYLDLVAMGKIMNALVMQRQTMDKEIEQAIIDVVSPFKKMNSRCRELAECIVEAFKESNSADAKHIEHLTETILLAFVWQKAESKKQFIEFFKQFEIAELVDEKSMLEAPSYSKEELKEILVEKKQSALDIENKLEDISLALYAQTLFGIFPPETSNVKTYYKQNNGTVIPFSDCMECAIRNLINALLWTQKGIFDVERLQKIAQDNHLSLKPELVEFYKKFPLGSSVDSQVVHDEWSQILSGIPEIHYVKKQCCEVDTTLSNLTTILNYLFCGNNAELKKLTKDQQLTELSRCLSVSGRKIRFTPKSCDIEKDREVSLEITIGDLPDFTLNLTKLHAEVIFPKDSFTKRWELVGSPNSPASMSVCSWIPNCLSESLKNCHFLKHVEYFAFINPLNRTLIDVLVKKYGALYNTRVGNLLARLIEQLPDDAHSNFIIDIYAVAALIEYEDFLRYYKWLIEHTKKPVLRMYLLDKMGERYNCPIKGWPEFQSRIHPLINKLASEATTEFEQAEVARCYFKYNLHFLRLDQEQLLLNIKDEASLQKSLTQMLENNQLADSVKNSTTAKLLEQHKNDANLNWFANAILERSRINFYPAVIELIKQNKIDSAVLFSARTASKADSIIDELAMRSVTQNALCSCIRQLMGPDYHVGKLVISFSPRTVYDQKACKLAEQLDLSNKETLKNCEEEIISRMKALFLSESLEQKCYIPSYWKDFIEKFKAVSKNTDLKKIIDKEFIFVNEQQVEILKKKKQ